jgi:acyl-coenzyme A synthetase/AMP-(fatty) acid ligase
MGEDTNVRWPATQRWHTRHEVHYGDRLVRCYVERAAHVDAMFRDVVSQHGANEALVLDEHRVAFAELDGRVERVAGNLAVRGVATGDRVALLLGNRLEFVYATLACARLGAIVVPMNVRQRRPEIAFMLNDCGAGTLVHEAELSGNLPPAEDTPALERRFSCGGPGKRRLRRRLSTKRIPPAFCIPRAPRASPRAPC